MARALASDPRLLVLINPTAGVDVRSKEFLLGRSTRPPPRGTGVLIVSDELDDLRICDRVLVMFQGRVVAEMPAAGTTTTWWPRWKEWTSMPETDHRARRRRPATGAGRAAARLGGRIASPGCATSRWCRRSSSIAIVGQIVNPVFLQTDNLINVLQTMSEIALLVLAADAGPDRRQDGPVAGVDLRPRARRRRLADRRRRRRRTGSGCCPAPGRSRSPWSSARSSARSTRC